MPFALYDSIDGALLNGYNDGLVGDFDESEDFNPPAEIDYAARQWRNRASTVFARRSGLGGGSIRGRGIFLDQT